MTNEEIEKFQSLSENEQFEIMRNWSGKEFAEYNIQKNGGYMTVDEFFSKVDAEIEIRLGSSKNGVPAKPI